jgi:hypothetical protein
VHLRFVWPFQDPVFIARTNASEPLRFGFGFGFGCVAKSRFCSRFSSPRSCCNLHLSSHHGYRRPDFISSFTPSRAPVFCGQVSFSVRARRCVLISSAWCFSWPVPCRFPSEPSRSIFPFPARLHFSADTRPVLVLFDFSIAHSSSSDCFPPIVDLLLPVRTHFRRAQCSHWSSLDSSVSASQPVRLARIFVL